MVGARILIVDDNAMNLELAAFVLGQAAYVVEVASGAAQAMACLSSFRPDLILMDIGLPGMDGLALTRLLKADPATRHIRIAAFTAFAMAGDEERMRAAGCDAYIAKPVDVARLADQVGACLGVPGQPGARP